jgi:hypothetical protein
MQIMILARIRKKYTVLGKEGYKTYTDFKIAAEDLRNLCFKLQFKFEILPSNSIFDPSLEKIRPLLKYF